eukprot:CAMPEP_0172716328 /NCGR_PEP_ID=MMETSP1074-20121228/68064_1 /TAXON_ID=2916 /ORGANISM="Ceratium fusus, Strain PA161109" /LENGTH=138 /DNA_ID=CAMNT_0013540995 /DNA_START=55 /DNA_END=471 /DNA_ORIENTATION=+
MGGKCCAGEGVKDGQDGQTAALSATAPLTEEEVVNPVATVATEGKEKKSKRKKEFRVHLKKTEGGPRLGVDVDLSDGDHLLVDKVNDGLVMQWNKANPDKEVRPNDKVMEVNGIKGDAAQMTETCKNQYDLELLILRE